MQGRSEQGLIQHSVDNWAVGINCMCVRRTVFYSRFMRSSDPGYGDCTSLGQFIWSDQRIFCMLWDEILHATLLRRHSSEITTGSEKAQNNVSYRNDFIPSLCLNSLFAMVIVMQVRVVFVLPPEAAINIACPRKWFPTNYHLEHKDSSPLFSTDNVIVSHQPPVSISFKYNCIANPRIKRGTPLYFQSSSPSSSPSIDNKNDKVVES